MFREFIDEIVYACNILYEKVSEDDTASNSINFLAREGKIVKEIFDFLYPYDDYGIETKYKLVSRNSTFLPSLESLDIEEFETLFRQYSSISALEFLKNLSLDRFSKEIRESMDIDGETFDKRIDSFQSSLLFEKLKANRVFRENYERELLEQRALLNEYFMDAPCPEKRTNLFDVGWKGTIQDHIYKALTFSNDQISLGGFYIGLVNPTSISKQNCKTELLFGSSKDRISKGFEVFNENRALYEILMSANHGSAKRYFRKENGEVGVILLDHSEADQFERLIEPIQAVWLESIERFTDEHRKKICSIELLSSHKRLVYSPQVEETQFFKSIFQPENFGIHEDSYFLRPHKEQVSIRGLLKALIKSDESKFGFWPYVFIKLNYGRFWAGVYKARQKLIHLKFVRRWLI